MSDVFKIGITFQTLCNYHNIPFWNSSGVTQKAKMILKIVPVSGVYEHRPMKELYLGEGYGGSFWSKLLNYVYILYYYLWHTCNYLYILYYYLWHRPLHVIIYIYCIIIFGIHVIIYIQCDINFVLWSIRAIRQNLEIVSLCKILQFSLLNFD